MLVCNENAMIFDFWLFQQPGLSSVNCEFSNPELNLCSNLSTSVVWAKNVGTWYAAIVQHRLHMVVLKGLLDMQGTNLIMSVCPVVVGCVYIAYSSILVAWFCQQSQNSIENMRLQPQNTQQVVFLMWLLFSHFTVRWFLWGIVLTLSYGKINLWLLPNLDNEKLGIIDSFKPLYSLERKKKSGKKSKTKKQDTKDDPSLEDQEDEPTNAGEWTGNCKNYVF